MPVHRGSPAVARVRRWALVAGLVGVALVALGLVVAPRRALLAYLAAYATALGVALGALAMVMIAHVTRAAWFVVLRRLAEVVAGTLPVFALLLLPVLLGAGVLYPWVSPGQLVEPRLVALVRAKHAYLNVPFFAVRAAVYFGVWVALALVLARWSARQDGLAPAGGSDRAAAPNGAAERLARRQRALSAAGLPAFALTVTFAAFDWLMSLEPAWFSTVYGLYVFSGGFVAALALLAVLAPALGRAAPAAPAAGPRHYGALGTLMLTFVAFWAYVAFSQLLVIWSGDVPLLARWYIPRLRGEWAWLGLLLVVGHFALPCLLLLSRGLKQRAPALGAVGAWLLLMHWVDVSWLVLPGSAPATFWPHWLDVAALVAVGGLATAFGAWRLGANAVVPMGDPQLPISLALSGADASGDGP